MTSIDPGALPDNDPADALSAEQVAGLLALLARQSTIDPAAPAADPPAATAAAPTTDASTQQVSAAGTDADPAASSPAVDAAVTSAPVSSVLDGPVEVPKPASDVAAPPAGTLVSQSYIPPGQDHSVIRFGLVVSVDDQANTAQVSWFLADPTTVDGDAITKVG